MWLKVHQPAAFYYAALSKAGEENYTKLIKDSMAHGVPVRGVDPAYSHDTWRITNRDDDLFEPSIMAGWLQVPGIGPALAERIIAHRAGLSAIGRYPMTIADLGSVKGIGPKIMSAISGIDSADPFGLRKVERDLASVRRDIEEGHLLVPQPTHTSNEILDAKADSSVVFLGMVKLKEYKDWVEDERARTGDSLDDIRARMRDPHLPTGVVLHCFDDGDEDVYVRIDRRVYPRFKNGIEHIRIGRDLVLVRARKSKNSFGASIYVKELHVIDTED